MILLTIFEPCLANTTYHKLKKFDLTLTYASLLFYYKAIYIPGCVIVF